MSATSQDYNFIRAMIKIGNPTWTAEQIDAALQKRIEEMNNPQNDSSCEMCSG
ncbi:MAG: hypothetical protein Q8M29_02370 [Bacteroidota bacterium]|nr:hypothetical protein [Bacteroidota bacterium]